MLIATGPMQQMLAAALASAPETVNQDPHGKAWLIRVRLADATELSSLMDAAAYQAYISDKEKETSA